jgi:hypothetical protein
MHDFHNAKVHAVTLSHGLMDQLCEYVIYQAGMLGVFYDHHMEFARDVRAG